LARTPRTWQGARSPSGLKRVRSAQRRHEVLLPRRSAAKTLVAKAVRLSSSPVEGQDPVVALTDALSALDRAAKSGAIHANAAARRKSRLVRKVNAELGGTTVQAAHVAKQTSKAQATKAAKARIAAGRADKAKGAQTAAGKARAALTRSTRSEGAEAKSQAKAADAESTATKTKATPAKAKSSGTKSSGTKAAGTKAAGSKAAGSKAAADKPAARSTAKKASPKT